jgi:hypothetical protein
VSGYESHPPPSVAPLLGRREVSFGKPGQAARAGGRPALLLCRVDAGASRASGLAALFVPTRKPRFQRQRTSGISGGCSSLGPRTRALLLVRSERLARLDRDVSVGTTVGVPKSAGRSAHVDRVVLPEQLAQTRNARAEIDVGSADGLRARTAWPTVSGCLPPPHRTVRAVLSQTFSDVVPAAGSAAVGRRHGNSGAPRSAGGRAQRGRAGGWRASRADRA